MFAIVHVQEMVTEFKLSEKNPTEFWLIEYTLNAKELLFISVIFTRVLWLVENLTETA